MDIYAPNCFQFLISESDKNRILSCIMHEFHVVAYKFNNNMRFSRNGDVVDVPLASVWPVRSPLSIIIWVLEDHFQEKVEGSKTDRLCKDIHCRYYSGQGSGEADMIKANDYGNPSHMSHLNNMSGPLSINDKPYPFTSDSLAMDKAFLEHYKFPDQEKSRRRREKRRRRKTEIWSDMSDVWGGL